MKGASQLVIIAYAIKILSSACVDLAQLDWEDLAIGLAGVGVLMAEVALFMNNTKFSGKSISTATGIVILAAAIKILASACADLGQMSWGDLGQGLTAIGILLAEIVAFTKLTSNAQKVISTGIALIAIAAAMKIFASAMQDMGALSWGDTVKGLYSMAGVLVAVTAALNLMPKNLVGMGIGLIAVSAAIAILTNSFVKMGSMNWSGVAKGLIALGGSMAIIAVGLYAMQNTIAGSGALIVAAVALSILAPVLALLGAMSWSNIARGLVAIAGALTIMGIAGYVLGPVVPAILSLAGSLALLGVSVIAIGAGVLVLGAGLTVLAVGLTSLASSLAVVCTGIIELVAALIVGIAKGVGEGIVALCEGIAAGSSAIFRAVKVLVLGLADVLVECLPVFMTIMVNFVGKLLTAISDYVPTMINGLFDFLTRLIDGLIEHLPEFINSFVHMIVTIIESVIDGLAQYLPDLIQSIADLVVSIVQGVVDALGNAKINISFDDIINVGLLAGVMGALALLAPLVPLALAGVIGFGIVMTELAIVLAAVGALAQIPGLDWLINEGGEFLGSIGTAIGQLIGGIVGGIAQGFTSSLPDIGTDLSDFMVNLQPFIDGAKQFDAGILDGVWSLVGVIYALTGANILDGITRFITGGSSLTKFGEELASFGPNMKVYADAVTGIDNGAVQASAAAAKALAEMTKHIPNEGGVAAWLAGENSISKFGDDIVNLGAGLAAFSIAVANVNPEKVIAAAGAAKALADMTKYIPNEGGVVAWFTGEKSLSKFSDDISVLGTGLAAFSAATVDVNPDNVIAAAGAAKALAELTSHIPNQGGVISWFTGEQSLAKFAEEFGPLGKGLAAFSTATTDVNPDSVIAAAGAAKAIAEVTNCLPNEGGVVAWFTGDQSLSKFADNLGPLGKGLAAFSTATTDVNPDNVIAAASAAQALAQLTDYIPNQGGIVSWFTGDQSMSKFAGQFKPLGEGLAAFSTATTDVNPEKISAAANAAKILAEMVGILPNQGGVAAWFTGDQSLSKFADQFKPLGEGLAEFSTAVTDVTPETVTAAANAAKVLAEMTSHIPNQGGVAAWFTGDQSLSKFADQMGPLGEGLAAFSVATAEVTPETVTAAANAAKVLAEMTSYIPNQGGMAAWFTGEQSMSKFANQMGPLGEGLAEFSVAVTDVNPEKVSAAASAAKALADMANVIPKSGGLSAIFGGENNIADFGSKLAKFGSALKTYSEEISGIAVDKFSAATAVFKELADMARGIANVNFEGLGSFGKSLGKVGKDGADKFIKAFENASSNVSKAGKKLIENLVKGAKNEAKTLSKTFSAFVDNAVSGLEDKYDSFYDAGSYLVDGFAAGISENDYKAEAKAAAMAKAAAEAAEKALDINSPSKVFRAIGTSVPEGFALGIEQLSGTVESSTVSMTDGALGSVRKAISKIASIVDGDMDVQPTVRPVLDLSEVRKGANTIGDLFNGDSLVGVTANVGSLNAAMNRRGQNGGNNDLVSAIRDLRKDMSKMGNTTYNLNGISYEEGSDVADAFKTIIRAAKMERRT